MCLKFKYCNKNTRFSNQWYCCCQWSGFGFVWMLLNFLSSIPFCNKNVTILFLYLSFLNENSKWMILNNGIYNYRMNALPCDFSTLVSLNVDFSSKFLLFFQEASWLTIMFHNFLQANLCEGSGAICEMAGRSRRGGVKACS